MDWKLYWEKRLGSVFGSRVRLSTRFHIEGSDDVVLTMGAESTFENMQEDASAFETWALAVRVAEARSVTLRVDGEASHHEMSAQERRHHNRFQYRARWFSELFREWFKTEPPPASVIPSAPGPNNPSLFLNEGDRGIGDESPVLSESTEFDLDADEKEIERQLAGEHPASAGLKEKFALERVERQLPVGVFAGRVCEESMVFPGKKSAIDLWGIAGGKLVLFELKNAGNTGLGALAELFFYSLVMHDLQRGVFGYDPEKTDYSGRYHAITKTKSIDAYILAPRFHTLIGKREAAVLDLFNEAFASAGLPIRFGLAQLFEQSPYVDIVKQA